MKAQNRAGVKTPHIFTLGARWT